MSNEKRNELNKLQHQIEGLALKLELYLDRQDALLAKVQAILESEAEDTIKGKN